MTKEISELIKAHGFTPDEDLHAIAEMIVIDCLNIISAQRTLDENESFREGFSHGRKMAWNEIRKKYGVL